MNEYKKLVSELSVLEKKIENIQKKYKKFSGLLKNEKDARNYMKLISRAFFIQGMLHVVSDDNKPSYIG
jgi:predicted  nucleic acid-binding Zn-ribbon protein